MNILKDGVRDLAKEEAEILWKNVRSDLEANGIHSKKALEKRLFKAIYPYAKEIMASGKKFTPAVTRFAMDYIDNELLGGARYQENGVNVNG